MIDTNFLYAGRASYVVRNPKGESVTVKVTKGREKINGRTGRPWPTTYFVTVRHNNDAWTRAGIISGGTSLRTLPGQFTSVPMRTRNIVEWSLKVINKITPLPAGYSLQHTGRCGRCAKLLREPESIASGLGPVCGGRV